MDIAQRLVIVFKSVLQNSSGSASKILSAIFNSSYFQKYPLFSSLSMTDRRVLRIWIERLYRFHSFLNEFTIKMIVFPSRVLSNGKLYPDAKHGKK